MKKRTLGAVAAALLAAVLVPATAAGSTLTIEDGTIVLRAAPGEQNRVGVDSNDDDTLVEVRDVNTPSYAGMTCEPAAWDPSAIACPPQPGGVRIELGDGDDDLDVGAGVPGTGPLVAVGGDGVDDLSAFGNTTSARLDGGSGNDILVGGIGGDTLLGGPGNDDLDGRIGGDVVLGGEGDDKLLGDSYNAPGADTIDGGPGYDRIEGDWSAPISQPQPPIAVSLDGQANDGRPGEGDNVTAVEWIHLNNPATLVAGGDSVDFEVFNASTAPSALTGGPGPDRLRSYDAPDTIDGKGGDDWIEAGYGDDRITGGPGRDTIDADAGSGACNFLVCRLPHGNDTIDARDGEVDSIECGPGTDVANVDKADTVANCETVNVAAGGGGPNGGGGGSKRCVVPKVKRGSKLAKAKAKLRRAGCKAKVVRVRSGVKRGRVVKLSPRAGKKLKAGAKVKVHVSRGKARARRSAVARSAAIDVVSPAPKVVTPVKLRCAKVAGGAGRVCGKRFKDDWARGWWTDPTRFEIVDVRLSGDTELTVPYDDFKSFKGEGFSTVKAEDGLTGKLKLPRRGATVPATVGVAKPVAWTMQSIGAWTTDDGSFDCSVRTQPQSPASSFAGVFAANPRRGTISVQWSIVPAGFRCPDEGPPTPDFDALPSEATTVHYKASGFRGAELLKLPISIEWEGVRESDGTRLKLDWSGRVLLRRVHHRL